MAPITEPQSRLKPQWFRWFELRPQLTLLLLVMFTLGPFVAKPFNLDEPLFLWAARHIQSNPANPYGFEVNWYGYPMPMWQVTKNPPLACYYLAGAASLLGWDERALHFAFLLPAVGAILGTYRLARHFCERPLFAAGTTLFTPVFLVSSTSLMCDTTMLAFWVWAVVLWVEGMAKPDLWRLTGSALLVTLAAYTKYFGICLIPLLAAYGLIQERKLGRWAAYLLIPIAGLIAYQSATSALYGRGLLSDAGDYALHANPFNVSQAANILTALAFTGACAAAATLLAPMLWRGRVLAGISVATLVFAWLVFAEGSMWQKYNALTGTSHGWLEVQMVFWAIGGVSVLGLAGVDVWHRRDAAAWLLALWIGGTFLFAGFVNWTINGRSILPLAPAVAILVARRLSPDTGEGKSIRRPGAWICSMAGALLALLVTESDYRFAQGVRQSARETLARYGHESGSLWFEGHWGWQYYLQELGGKAVARGQPSPPTGDFLAIPTHNTNITPPNEKMARLQDILSIQEPRLIATFNTDVGAGFYASIWGPLPFAFGHISPGKVFVYAIGPTVDAPPPNKP